MTDSNQAPTASTHRLIERLRELCSYDTQNPGGDERPLAQHLESALRSLGAAHVESFMTGAHAAAYARFGTGTPRLIINAHIDTVPANAGYTRPPLGLVREGDRLYGLGAADTKGAIAALLEALAVRQATGRPMPAVAILFSGDEERTGSVVQDFLTSPRAVGLRQAIVCEPTGCHLGVRHRGIGSAILSAVSPGGHSSRADALPAPMAILARAAVALERFGRTQLPGDLPDFPGLCLNLAGFRGLVAFNVIPSRAELLLSLRPPPGRDVEAILRTTEAIARAGAAPDPITWQDVTIKPGFATRDVTAFSALLGSAAGEPIDLDFWTEAALYAAHGIDAVVFGPGDIKEAHAPDEFVTLAQLETACRAFGEVLA